MDCALPSSPAVCSPFAAGRGGAFEFIESKGQAPTLVCHRLKANRALVSNFANNLAGDWTTALNAGVHVHQSASSLKASCRERAARGILKLPRYRADVGRGFPAPSDGQPWKRERMVDPADESGDVLR